MRRVHQHARAAVLRTNGALNRLGSRARLTAPARLPSVARRSFQTDEAAFVHPNAIEEVSGMIKRWFGEDIESHLKAAKTLHTTSVYAAPGEEDKELFTLRVTQSPSSSFRAHPFDSMLLNVARASSDVVIESAQNLRDEPNLTGNVSGTVLINAPTLGFWRTSALDKVHPPQKLVLTSGAQGLDLSHPLFARSEGPVHVFTTAAFVDAVAAGKVALPAGFSLASPSSAGAAAASTTADGLRTLSIARDRSIVLPAPAPTAASAAAGGSGADREVAGMTRGSRARSRAAASSSAAPLTPVALVGVPRAEQLSLRSALEYAHARLGAATAAIEAGPSTTQELYSGAEPPLVDVLFLSIYSGPLEDPQRQLVRPRVLSAAGSGGSGDKPFALTRDFLERHFTLRREIDYSHAGWRFMVLDRKQPGDDDSGDELERGAGRGRDVRGLIAPPVSRRA